MTTRRSLPAIAFALGLVMTLTSAGSAPPLRILGGRAVLSTNRRAATLTGLVGCTSGEQVDLTAQLVQVKGNNIAIGSDCLTMNCNGEVPGLGDPGCQQSGPVQAGAGQPHRHGQVVRW